MSRSRNHRKTTRIGFQTLECRHLLTSDLVITEFMADNSSTLEDEDGDFPDWVELFNPTPHDIRLDGWHLSDNVDELDKWSFPDMTLAAGNFLTVFASTKDRTLVGQPLHTNFRISSSGEYLALSKTDQTAPGGFKIATEFDGVAFPNRAEDLSFGIGQSVTVDSVVDAGATAKLHFPTDGSLGTSWTTPGFNDSSWQTGTNAIGYEQSVPGFTVQDAKSSGTISNLSQALALLNGSNRISETTAITPYVNFLDTGGAGNFGNTLPFPNNTAADDNDFAIRATGTVHIPESGTWTFGTNSDDGVRVRIDGSNIINDDSLHAPQNRFGQRFLSAGTHDIELIFFERGGGAEVELFAAKGSYSLFNAGAFRLVGDVDNGGLVVETVPDSEATTSGYSSVIETNVLNEMYASVSGAYMRIPFFAPNASSLDSLTLRMRYDDGFVAYLNGTEVARRNVPNGVQYNSTASSDRFDNDGLLEENIDISDHANLIVPNQINVLALHALNDAVDSDEFLAIAELAEVTVNESTAVYFTSPTPGAFNAETGVAGFLIDEIQLSHPHGFYDNSFSLQLDVLTPGTTIRYTLDGTEPTSSNGTDYSTPIAIGQTTTVRARAFKSGFDPSNIETATYLFVDDIVAQSPTGSAPAGWPSSTNINGQTLDYGMDPAIVNHSVWGPQMEAALKQVPSMSIVMDIDDLLGGSQGIYTHAGNHGKTWERPISLELIEPDGSPGFQVNAGLRIRGGFSRSGNNPKHAFRLFFRDEYGDGKLNFPLFQDEGVDEFDKVDLRTTQNYSWSFRGNRQNAFVRDVFSRDLQGLMGHPYSRSRFYHLYINGHYWGLFQTQERTEARFAASYMGGDSDDYDVVKSTGSSGNYQNEATDGNLNAYQRLADYFYQSGGLGDSKMADYWKAQGMNPDGTRNPSFERLLDVDNIIDYMILTYYTSDADGPGSKFTRPRVNNYFGIFNRANPDGFKFFEHDSEHSLDTGNAAGANYNMVTPLTTGGSQFRYFNPHWMHEQLANTNSEYRTRFADRVHELLYNDGFLTAENAKALIDSRAAEFDLAIIAESARWGDSKQSNPYTKNDWRDAVNSVKSFIDNRIPVVIGQLRGQGWYPGSNPPLFTVNGQAQNSGALESSDFISMAASSSTSFSTIVNDGSLWKYLDDGSNQGTAWREVGFNDSHWDSGNAELGYGDGNETTVLGFGPNSSNKYRTTYFRKSFHVANANQYQTLRVRLQRDDGAVVYLNGNEIVRSNMPGGTIRYDDFAAGVVGGGDENTFFDFEIDVEHLVSGTNVLAVEVHQANAGSSDISFDLELQGGVLNAATNVYYTLDGSDPRAAGGAIHGSAILFDGTPFTIDTTRTIKARVFDNGEWSAMSSATYLADVAAGAGNLAITEVNYNPHDALPQFGEIELDNDRFEFIELTNIGADRIDLTGVEFVSALNGDNLEGITFAFATQTLDPGEHIVVVRDRNAFVSRYGNSVRIAEASDAPAGIGVFDGGLGNGSELLTLQDRNGSIIQQFEYKDGGSWPGRADGNASTLEVLDPTGDYNTPSNWRSSNEFGGSPGAAGTGPINDVIVNEVLTHTDLPQIDAVELVNVGDSAVQIGSWYMSDNNVNYFKYQFSIVAGTMAAGEYRVVDENELGFGFKGQENDDVWLIAADLTGKPLRFADHFEFSAAENGVSFGRWPNAVGLPFPMSNLSLGSDNSGPIVPEVAISEVHYHPMQTDTLVSLATSELEYVEISNASGSAQNISHWRLNKAIDFEFSNGTVLPNNGRLVVVSFDPVAEPAKVSEFRTVYGMSGQATLLGPFSGQLDNGGEKLELDRPEDLAQLGLGYVLVDRVVYDELTPWPTGADGQGQSLNRQSASAFGNFAESWEAATPTPGSSAGATNSPPVASDDTFVVLEGGTINVGSPGILANDSDLDGDTLTASIFSLPTAGSLNLNADGSFVYVHNGSETTSDRFQYRAHDGNGGSAIAWVNITIQTANDAPVATGDSYAVNEGETLAVSSPGLLANDTDADGHALTAVLTSPPNYGTLIVNENGSFTYQHDGSEATSDSFTYEARDGFGGVDEATVTISIDSVNDTPVAEDDTFSVMEGGTLVVSAPGVLANDSDEDEDQLSALAPSNPQHGTLTFSNDGSFRYIHDGSETTADSFTYRVSDGNGGQATATVRLTIEPVNDNPVARDDFFSIESANALLVGEPGVLANDTDVDSTGLTVSLLSGPQFGELDLHPDGSFTYQFTGGGDGQDQFTYRASDAQGGSSSATVTLSISTIHGDLTNDGLVDDQDIDLLCREIRSGDQFDLYDLNQNGVVDMNDVDFLVQQILQTNMGDANLDGIFDSSDLILVFSSGQFEDGIDGNSGWRQGDWNCDGEFGTGDVISAFQAGAYVSAATPSIHAAGLVRQDIEQTGSARPKTKRRNIVEALATSDRERVLLRRAALTESIFADANFDLKEAVPKRPLDQLSRLLFSLYR